VRDVVEHHRQADSVRDGGEMPDQAGLRGLVVVRRDDQQAVRARLLRGPGQLDRVGRVVGADARHDPGPVAHRLDDDAQQGLLLGVGGRR
jgi:hypothetical protein